MKYDLWGWNIGDKNMAELDVGNTQVKEAKTQADKYISRDPAVWHDLMAMVLQLETFILLENGMYSVSQWNGVFTWGYDLTAANDDVKGTINPGELEP